MCSLNAPIVAGLCSLFFSIPTICQPTNELIDDAVVKDAKDWLSAPVVEIVLGAQNRRYTGLDQAEIDRLDRQWRNEREAGNQPLIAATLNNPLSTYLTQIQALSGGLYSEIFVVDSNGLNAGQSAVTSDFWQGDEAKFQKTYQVSADAVFVDDPQQHEGTRTWRAQLNFTLVDRSGNPAGAATVEINLTELERLRRR